MKEHTDQHTLSEDNPKGYYTAQYVNRSGWVIGLHRVLFGVRVVIYHKDDDYSITGNFCGGPNPKDILELYSLLSTWLRSDPSGVQEKCHFLQYNEKRRPWGNDKNFKAAVEALAIMAKEKNISN